MVNGMFSRFIRFIGFAAATLATATLCLWGGETQAEDARAAQGERDYRALCASCHGAEARGDGPVAVALDPKPSDLTAIAARRDGVFPVPTIARLIDGRDPVVAHGNRDMPVWGRQFSESVGDRGFGYSRGRIQLLVEYLKTIQNPPLGKAKD